MMAILRPAQKTDLPAIRSLIYRARINPLGLDWRRFIVAVAEDGVLIACGQVKPHQDGSLELASIAVDPEHRGAGLARAIIARLLRENPGVLYLTCRAGLERFYQRFGFQRVDGNELPAYFHRIRRFASRAKRLGIIKEELLVMVREP